MKKFGFTALLAASLAAGALHAAPNVEHHDQREHATAHDKKARPAAAPTRTPARTPARPAARPQPVARPQPMARPTQRVAPPRSAPRPAPTARVDEERAARPRADGGPSLAVGSSTPCVTEPVGPPGCRRARRRVRSPPRSLP